MKVTPFVVAMSGIQNDIYKAAEALVAQLDMKQWPMAGIELGRIEELANRLAATCRLARDPLHEAAWLDAQEKRIEAEAEREDAAR